MSKITKINIRRQKGGWKVSLSRPDLSASGWLPEGAGVEDLIESMLGFRPRPSSQPLPPEPAPETDV